MNRRQFLQFLSLSAIPTLPGCGTPGPEKAYPDMLPLPDSFDPEQVARDTLDSAKVYASDGTVLWLPDGRGHYRSAFIRDMAICIENFPSYFTADEIKGAFDWYAARCDQATGQVPDGINLDGSPVALCWGSRYGIDGAMYLVDVAYSHYLKTGNASIYNDNSELLGSLLSKVPISSTGCVHIDNASPFIGWGFCDTIRLTGDVLFPTVLLCRAYCQMAEMSGDPAYLALADFASDGIESMYVPERGLYRAASIKGHGQLDAMGSAFAFYTDTTRHASEIANALSVAPVVSMGAIRHVVPDSDFSPQDGMAWESYFSYTNYNVYQNGGYWPIATPWVCAAVGSVDPELADRIMRDLRTFVYTCGPVEWLADSQIAANNYCVSATSIV